MAKEGGKKFGRNLLMPEYQIDPKMKISRENNMPPAALYMGLGYDPEPGTSKQKHYRRYYQKELEEVDTVMPRTPFDEFKIIRGQARGLKKSWFGKSKTDESGSVTDVKTVGRFKGIVKVENIARRDDYRQISRDRVNILKSQLNELSLKIRDKELDFDYNKLDSVEFRSQFRII